MTSSTRSGATPSASRRTEGDRDQARHFEERSHFGFISPSLAVLFLLASFGYAIMLSLLALLLDELGLHRYRRLGDLAAVAAAAVVENLGYRQLTAWWRLQGW
ncbi:hypothetical protein [Streptomyces asoensis]